MSDPNSGAFERHRKELFKRALWRESHVCKCCGIERESKEINSNYGLCDVCYVGGFIRNMSDETES